ncbi:hypothetical protein AURDEDRAFT_127316 [Auricularia subglabra TFB-10046 SS5]|nr:hypothetical protein AURDEDRAFT_127316 [Auricularia subglabra TFB-10046 SS5]
MAAPASIVVQTELLQLYRENRVLREDKSAAAEQIIALEHEAETKQKECDALRKRDAEHKVKVAACEARTRDAKLEMAQYKQDREQRETEQSEEARAMIEALQVKIQALEDECAKVKQKPQPRKRAPNKKRTADPFFDDEDHSEDIRPPTKRTKTTANACRRGKGSYYSELVIEDSNGRPIETVIHDGDSVRRIVHPRAE